MQEICHKRNNDQIKYFVTTQWVDLSVLVSSNSPSSCVCLCVSVPFLHCTLNSPFLHFSKVILIGMKYMCKQFYIDKRKGNYAFSKSNCSSYATRIILYSSAFILFNEGGVLIG